MADLQRGWVDNDAGRLPMQVERVRTFDTPEFAGMRFLEVEAKSALNRVKGMPFGWSINPYRGCSHACSYCLSGDTPILMADGRTRPLADVRPGDRVYGTVRRGSDRRYVVTTVLDHWSTNKPAYRVVLDDGATLVASGDHRFLTARGWKHVTGAGQRHARRAQLTPNDRLLGPGAFPPPPKHSPEYARGYLCGMIRGAGHVGSDRYARPGRADGEAHRFRLAPVDLEALERARAYLSDGGVGTTRFSHVEGRKPISAIGTSARADVEAIRRLIAWPDSPTEPWTTGFLAGIYDAEGSYSRGCLRITNGEETIRSRIAAGLERLGFSSVVETRANGCKVVRLLGGLGEQVRFLMTVDPAITRKRAFEGRALKSAEARRVVAIESLGLTVPLFDITTGTGDFIADGLVSHNCFARPTHAYLNLSPLGDFERTVVVKTNLVEVLRRELVRPSWKGERVAMGTNTDPYQRCEGRYRLMPGVIDALAEAYTPFSILTKGTLIRRDLERLRAAADRVEVGAAFTIGMLDVALWRDAEPGTPSPEARLDAVRALNEAGIPTGVMLAPIMPGLNDDHEQLAELVDRAAAAGATHITPIVLHLRPGVREVFWPWLEASHPELVDRYSRLYQRATAAKAYREPVERFVADQRRAAWRRHGRPAAPARRQGSRQSPASADPAGPAATGPGSGPAEQLTLL